MIVVRRAASVVAMLLCALSLGTTARAAELPSISLPFFASIETGSSAFSSIASPIAAAPVAPRFASLVAAVDAQIVGDAAPRDLSCLAVAIYYEAKGEPLPGQLAVADVILNRVRSGRYPSDACGVVTQRGEFSFVHGGQLPAVDTARGTYRTALKLAKVAMAELWDSPAPRALFFHARRIGMGRGGTQVAMIGNHIFYR